MDFIERLFGLSPDGGDGSIELAYIAALLAILAAVAARVVLKRRAARRSR